METNSRTKWAIFNNPLPLLEISNPKIIAAIDNYLPYSTGMEIECLHGSRFNQEDFISIPDIMSVDNDSPDYEQRYRIPNGLKGLVCLWKICEALKKNCTYHEESGHHYHTDCTDCFEDIKDRIFLKENEEWILKELDEWNYTGKYNGRSLYGWFQPNQLGTLEFRCADMTFEYSIIAKRIIHANDITRRLKALSKVIRKQRGLKVVRQELEKLQKDKLDLQKDKSTKLDSVVAKQVIKSRTIRL